MFKVSISVLVGSTRGLAASTGRRASGTSSGGHSCSAYDRPVHLQRVFMVVKQPHMTAVLTKKKVVFIVVPSF